MHIFLNHLLSKHAKYGILFMEKYGLKGASPMEDHNPGQRFLPQSKNSGTALPPFFFQRAMA